MELINYLTRSILILSSFILLYLLAYRKDNYFQLYRVFLILGIICSFILPFIEIRYSIFLKSLDVNNFYKQIDVPVSAPISENVINKRVEINWFNLVYWVYLSGVIIHILRFIYSLINILKLIKNCSKINKDGFTFFVGDMVDEPFTLGSYIFLNNDTYFKERFADIIAHEKVHLKQQHWIDVLLAEILIITQWFNPLSWYYSRLVKQNLEYIADQKVINLGFSIEKYIQSIICVTMGAEASVLANHFRFSQNKQRLKMMKNVRKSKWKRLKLLLVLPLISGFLWAFSEAEYKYDTNSDITLEQNFNINKEKFLIRGYVSEPNDTIEIQKEDGTYEVRVIRGSSLPGTSIIIKGTTRGTVADRNGFYELEVSKGEEIVYSFVGFKTAIISIVDQKDIDVQLEKTVYELDPSVNYKSQEENIKTSSANVEEPVFVVVEDMPSYKGGNNLFFEKLKKLVKQEKVKDSNLSGVVNVQFRVNVNGKIENIRARNRTGNQEANIAVSLVSLLGDWKPGIQRGKPVQCYVSVPVEFK